MNRINQADNDSLLEELMIKLFDHFGYHIQQIDHRTLLLTPGNIKTDAFPKIDEDGFAVTFNRDRALMNENIAFLNQDSPIVERALSLILGENSGNCSFGVMHSDDYEEIYLETIFVLECIAPIEFHIDRFLPPTPVRIVVNHKMEDCTELCSFKLFKKNFKDDEISGKKLLNNRDLTEKLLPDLIKLSYMTAKKKPILSLTKAMTK